MHRTMACFWVVVMLVEIILITASFTFLVPLHSASYKTTSGVIESVACESISRGNARLALTLEAEIYSASVNAYECNEMRQYFRDRYVEIKHSPGGTTIIDVTYWDEGRFSENKLIWGSYALCVLIFICANFFLFSFYKNKLKRTYKVERDG
jgi:hypothetical protein